MKKITAFLGFVWFLEFNVVCHAAPTIVDVPGAGVFQESLSDDNSVLDLHFAQEKGNKSVRYLQKEFNECSMMALYRIPGTQSVAIDGSCPSSDGQIYTRIYQWEPSGKKWCLIRNITGESADQRSGDWQGTLQVERVLGCHTIGSDDSFSVQSADVSLKGEESELNSILKRDLRGDAAKNNLANVPYYFPLELSLDIKKINIQKANDLAYYLVEAGRASDALPLLQSIVNAYPDRVVAKLNFADALWQIGVKEQASEMYGKYVNQMRAQNKGTLIPLRVPTRVAHSS